MPARWMPSSALLALAAGALVASGAVTWSAQSVLTTTVGAPPVRFEAGDGSGNPRYVQALRVGQNGTWFEGTLTGRIGGEVQVKDVVRLVNEDDAPRTVTLHGTSVTDARVTTFRWPVRDGAATVATLDMKTAGPTAALTLGPGESRVMDLRLRIVGGAASSPSFTFSTWLVIG